MLERSIDFLLENAGPVIQYRLRKEILRDFVFLIREKRLDYLFSGLKYRIIQRVYLYKGEKDYFQEEAK